jgi:hypothetical protein
MDAIVPQRGGARYPLCMIFSESRCPSRIAVREMLSGIMHRATILAAQAAWVRKTISACASRRQGMRAVKTA